MKSGIVGAVLVGSAVAAPHHGNHGFHFRRQASEEGVCTVYTTVYVTAAPVPSSFPSIPTSSLYSALSSASITVAGVPGTDASTSCTESEGTAATPAPSAPAVGVSKPVASSSVYVQASSSSAVDVPTPTPAPSSPASVPGTGESTSCTESESVSVPPNAPTSAPSVPEASVPAVPSSSAVDVPTPTPAPSSPVSVPGTGESTSCTESESVSVPANTPTPAPSVPATSVPAVPSVPAASVPTVPTSTAAVDVPTPTPAPSSPASVPGTGESTSCTDSTSLYQSAPVASSPAASVPVPVASSAVSVSVPVSSASKPAVVPSTSAAVVPSTSAAVVPSSSAVVPSSSATPPKSSSVQSETPKPTGSSSYGTNLVPNGQKLQITYTPYASDGQCMTATQIETDLAKINELGYPSIRVYSTDCGVFENVVPTATKYGMKITYGIFLDENKGPGSDGANEQLDAIIKNAPKDSFAMLIVGNEYISGHGGSAETLAPYIKTCKEKLVAAGFPSTIPVTTTETVGAIEQYGAALCDSIDVVAAQIHPFFDGGIAAIGAGAFAVKQLAQAAAICPEAAARGQYITEIGWPTAGNTNGLAIPGVLEQKLAIASIIEAVGDKATLFSWQNDEWKEPGALNVEQSFGCASVLGL